MERGLTNIFYKLSDAEFEETIKYGRKCSPNLNIKMRLIAEASASNLYKPSYHLQAHHFYKWFPPRLLNNAWNIKDKETQANISVARARWNGSTDESCLSHPSVEEIDFFNTATLIAHTSSAEAKIMTELVNLVNNKSSIMEANAKLQNTRMIELTNALNAASTVLADLIKAQSTIIQANMELLDKRIIELTNVLNAKAEKTNNVGTLTLQLSQCGVSTFGPHKSKQDD